MSEKLLPFVRHMLVCNQVERDSHHPRSVTLHGLLTHLVRDWYPTRASFSVYLVLTEGRSAGFGRISVTNAVTNEIVYLGTQHNNPLHVHAFSFRVTDCEFRDPGDYWVEFDFDGVSLSQELLQLR